jgi:hypothetical protein
MNASLLCFSYKSSARTYFPLPFELSDGVNPYSPLIRFAQCQVGKNIFMSNYDASGFLVCKILIYTRRILLCSSETQKYDTNLVATFEPLQISLPTSIQYHSILSTRHRNYRKYSRLARSLTSILRVGGNYCSDSCFEFC